MRVGRREREDVQASAFTPAVLSLLWSVAFEFLNLLLSMLGVQACVPPWQHVQHVPAFIAVVINTWKYLGGRLYIVLLLSHVI